MVRSAGHRRCPWSRPGGCRLTPEAEGAPDGGQRYRALPLAPRGTWGTFFSGQLECTDDDGGGAEPGEKNCETAFAFGGDLATCFVDIDEDGDGNGDFDRWGWTNGPLGSGTFVWDVYAGAGQCDLSRGTLVGSLVVSSDGYNMTVTLELEPPYTMEDAQLYVGGELLPRNGNGEFTVAPGQYPQVVEFDDGPSHHTFGPVPVSGDVHVVAHATVCGFGDEPPHRPVRPDRR